MTSTTTRPHTSFFDDSILRFSLCHAPESNRRVKFGSHGQAFRWFLTTFFQDLLLLRSLERQEAPRGASPDLRRGEVLRLAQTREVKADPVSRRSIGWLSAIYDLKAEMPSSEGFRDGDTEVKS